MVDPLVYNPFQILRAPWASKMSAQGTLLPSTMFIPSCDDHTAFAGYVDASIRRELPEPTPFRSKKQQKRSFKLGHADINKLYLLKFEQERTGTITFDSSPVEIFRRALELMHPERACHWWSWFRLCGIVYRVMHPHYIIPVLPPKPPSNDTVKLPTAVPLSRLFVNGKYSSDDMLEVFLDWSRKHYKTFDRQENIDMIYGSEGKPASGSWLLSQLVMFDNPNAHFPQLCEDRSTKREYNCR